MQQDYKASAGDHPITPPPTLVASLRNSAPHGIRDAGATNGWRDFNNTHRELWLVNHAYAAGADQELEACCQALYSRYVNTGLVAATAATVSQEMRDWLRTTRRPKPPSLKEQALLAIDTAVADGRLSSDVSNVVRRALEALDD